MPRISDISVLKTAPQPALTIRKRARKEELPIVIAESFLKLARYFNEVGEQMSDVPFAAFHNMDAKELDVEMGFPVAYTIPGKGDIESVIIPEGKSIFCMYIGAHDKKEPVYQEITEWITENGYKVKGISYEYYYNGPKNPKNEHLTKIIMPLK